jgi:hypothetical protein
MRMTCMSAIWIESFEDREGWATRPFHSLTQVR